MSSHKKSGALPLQANTAVFQTHIEKALASNGQVVAGLLSAFPQTLAIYAFGSQTQGTAGADSDLDLAVLVAGYADPLQLWEQAGQLASLLGCAVDLLDLRAASTVMQHQVISQGRRLWAQGSSADFYECFVLNEKNALDFARAGLLSDIAKDGRVYGG